MQFRCLGWEDSQRKNDNPLQYSCLVNPLYREAWQAIVHGIIKESVKQCCCSAANNNIELLKMRPASLEWRFRKWHLTHSSICKGKWESKGLKFFKQFMMKFYCTIFKFSENLQSLWIPSNCLEIFALFCKQFTKTVVKPCCCHQMESLSQQILGL